MHAYVRYHLAAAGFCGLLIFSIAGASAVADDRERGVTIDLRAAVTVDHPILMIADVAEVRGGDVGLRRRISQLDLAELAAPPSREELRRSRIALRLLLEGIHESQYLLTGSNATEVTFQHSILNDERLLEALREPLATLWHMSPDSILIRLTQPLDQALPKGLEISEQLRLAPFLGPETVPGRQRITFGVYDHTKLVQTFTIPVDVQIQLAVAVATRDLPSGTQITIDDVRFEPRRLVGGQALRMGSHEVLNKFVLRVIRAGQTIETDQFAERSPESVTAAEKSAGVEVRSRSLVSIVARRKSLRVVFRNAELLSTARVGETVRVRNLESNNILVGRLVTPTEVEVSF